MAHLLINHAYYSYKQVCVFFFHGKSLNNQGIYSFFFSKLLASTRNLSKDFMDYLVSLQINVDNGRVTNPGEDIAESDLGLSKKNEKDIICGVNLGEL